jgi:hypothetical protein
VGAVLAGVFDALEASFDIECEGFDLAGEAGFGRGEGADVSHCDVPFDVVEPRPSRPRWLSKRSGTDGAHPQGRNEMEDGRE